MKLRKYRWQSNYRAQRTKRIKEILAKQPEN